MRNIYAAIRNRRPRKQSRRRKITILRPTHLIVVFSLLTLCTLSLALGQERGKVPAKKTQIITASVTPDGVRIAAPSAVVQLRLEVYDDAGQKLLDTEQRGGNVLDWHLQGAAGGRVADGTYLCVVTVNNSSGQLSQKLGLVTVNAQSITLRPAGVAELSPLQTQVVGLEGGFEGLTIVPAENTPPITVVTHTGDEAQVTRTRGPLTFRSGDFFSGTDKEQMRLTEEGNLGIGTVSPQATLDVAGTVRAQDGIVFGDGSVLKSANELKPSTTTLGVTNVGGGVIPNLGTGTPGSVLKWVDGAGTAGDSLLSENGTSIVHRGSNFQFTAAANAAVDTNLMFLDASNKTMGMLAGPTPAFLSNNGPYFALRGNTYSQLPNQRGIFALSAGLVNSPAPGEGSIKFLTGADQLRLMIDNAGQVGIGTAAPTSKLEVAGNLKITGANNGLIFPDGTKQTTAGGASSSMSGTSIVSAINDPATVGTIADERLPGSLPRLNSANTFSANQIVNANVTASGNMVASGIQSTSTGYRFPDGSVQTIAAGKTYTTFPFGSDVEVGQPGGPTVSIMQLDNLPPGPYMVTATIQFENRSIFNKRLVACQLINEATWFFRIEGQGGAMDQMPITMHTVINQGGTVRLYCQAIDGLGRSNIFARARRFTAIRLGDVVTQ